jgi:hypothetical protein
MTRFFQTLGRWFEKKRTDWFPDYELQTARIDDKYYDNLIRMYRARAKLWRNVGLVNLLLTAVIIFVGFSIFWTGEDISGPEAERESKLVVDLASYRRQLADISASGARTLAQEGIMSRASVLGEILGRVQPSIETVKNNPSRMEGVVFAKSIVETATRIIESLDWSNAIPTGPVEEKKKKRSDVVIRISDARRNDSGRFPSESLDVLGTAFALSGERKVDTLKVLNQVGGILDRFSTGTQTDDDKQSLESQLSASTFRSFNDVNSQIQGRKAEAELANNKWQLDSAFREEERQAIEENITGVERQLVEVRAERDKLLFMSWVPDLTLRVGAVILLLFLTQILIGAYRYTISLSSYYLARADAIQLLQPQAHNASWYNIEHFKSLLHELSPDSLEIERVSTPSDQIVDLAKAWIGRKP